MSAADAAAEILRREQSSPGSVPPALLAKAKQLAGGGGASGSVTLPEVKIEGAPDNRGVLGRIFNTGVSFDAAGKQADQALDAAKYGPLQPPGRAEQFVRQAGEAGFVGANEYANAGLLGIPQATGMTPGKDTPGYAALRADHPMAAMGGQIAGLVNPANPANIAAGAIAGPLRGAIGGSLMGRALAGGVEGAVAGGAGSGTITAAGGGSGDQIFNAAATGAGVGGALGAAGSLVMEPSRFLKGLFASRGSPQTGQMLPPPGPGGAPGAPRPLPGIPDLEVPPRPEPVASSAPHEPTPPIEETAMSTVHRPGPGDTGMGAEEARRALDTEALHMANRSAAVKKLLDIIPPGADSQWLGRMTTAEREKLADFVGVTQAGDDTWRAVGDALDAKVMGPTTRPSPPLPREPDLAAQLEAERMARGQEYLRNRPPMDSTSPTTPIPMGDPGMPGIPGAPRLPNLSPDALQMGMSALRGRGLGHGPLGMDPMLGMLLQSPAFIKATGMAAGTKLPAATNRQPGQPLDLLNLYGL